MGTLHSESAQVLLIPLADRLVLSYYSSSSAIMDSAKLAKMQASVRIGGKGTPRRKVKEVNMFKSDGNVIHFSAPKVHASVPVNMFAIYGNGEEKELTELVPGILNQLGPDSLASPRKLAESYQAMQKEKGEDGEKKDDDDDEIPELVEGNFEGKGADVE